MFEDLALACNIGFIDGVKFGSVSQSILQLKYCAQFAFVPLTSFRVILLYPNYPIKRSLIIGNRKYTTIGKFAKPLLH